VERREVADALEVQGVKKRKPPAAAKAHTAIVVAPENGMLRKKRISISGSGRRSSYQTSAPRQSSENANSAIVPADVQPALGASMIA